MRDVRDREKEGEKWQARRAVSDMVGLLLESHIRGLVDDLEPDPEPWLCASLHPPGPPPLGGSDSRRHWPSGVWSPAFCPLQLFLQARLA